MLNTLLNANHEIMNVIACGIGQNATKKNQMSFTLNASVDINRSIPILVNEIH